MKFLLLNLLFLLGSPFLSSNGESLHQFHISKCSIEYSKEDKALQITVHIFIDDLEEALKEQGVTGLFLGTEKEHDKADEYIQKYFEQKLGLTVNKKEVKLNFIGKETSDDLDALWCYLEVSKVKSIKELTVTNNLLMEIFDDQKNIINVKGPNNKKEYFMFIKGNNQETIVY